ncbi:MAG TPA: ATP-binding protein [Longimicrobium sp.]|nr:ATP-binding protein [Longimicrobium sp.]
MDWHSETFVVDASLLEELGDRLIGRAPIALAELVKNSYDADAGMCRIEFGDDQIVISDNGTGMSQKEFHDFWMRIGTTHKIDERRSEGGRSLTGSKGIGRLSVQFLAAEMTLESTSEKKPEETLYVVVDWSKVVRGKDLDTVQVLWDTRPEHPEYPCDSPTGTRITLKKMKSTWDADALESLGREVWRLRSPFKRPAQNPCIRSPEEFEIEVDAPLIESAWEAFDKVRHTLFDNWKARIRGTLDSGRLGSKADIVIEFKEGYPDGADAARSRESVALPIRPSSASDRPLVDRARFEILIFKTEGKQPGGIAVADLRSYLSEFGNVSVYDAGFRLPYYGSGRDASGQDWLSIALDQGRRLNQSDLLPEQLRIQNKYMQDLPAPGRIFGAVEIDTNHERSAALKSHASPGEWLQIQPGRDRLHDNGAFAQLRDLVRFSLDYYANRYRLRAYQQSEKERDREPPTKKYDRVLDVLDQRKSDIPAPVFQEIKREVADARKASESQESALDRRAALLAPLATAGITAVALSHELARETRFLASVGSKLRRIAASSEVPELVEVADQLDNARKRLDSLRNLFSPFQSGEDSESIDRLRVQGVVNQVVSSMRVLTPGVTYNLSGIPGDLRFPAGSLAEWNALLQNVIANAWNAMLDSPAKILLFRGGRTGTGREWLNLNDTGKGLGIPVAQSDKLFEPFERRLNISPENRTLAIGGHGLGLAIARMIANRRSATVAFVEPERGFSTTFAISWKGTPR